MTARARAGGYDAGDGVRSLRDSAVASPLERSFHSAQKAAARLRINERGLPCDAPVKRLPCWAYAALVLRRQSIGRKSGHHVCAKGCGFFKIVQHRSCVRIQVRCCKRRVLRNASHGAAYLVRILPDSCGAIKAALQAPAPPKNEPARFQSVRWSLGHFPARTRRKSRRGARYWRHRKGFRSTTNDAFSHYAVSIGSDPHPAMRQSGEFRALCKDHPSATFH